MNYFEEIMIQELSENFFHLGDIGYENNSKSVELLIYGYKKTSTLSAYRSVIFEIPAVNTLLSTAAIPAHMYDGVYFESLDHIYGDKHFVASGIEAPGSPNKPYYMRFKYDDFNGGCLNRKNDMYVKKESKTRPDKKWINKTYVYQVPEVKENSTKEMRIETSCSNIIDNKQ